MDVLDISKIKIVPSDTEIPVHNNPTTTKRPLCSEFPDNTTIIDALQAVYDPLKVQECTPNLFDGDRYTVIDNIKELKDFLSQLLIKFDTSPKNYTKSDFDNLMVLLYRSLLFLYENHPLGVITDKWLDPHSDKKVPSEKLVKETIDAESERIEGLISDETSARQSADSDLQDNIDSEARTRAAEITRVEGLISAEELARQQADTNLQNTKQDNLTAGDNISITNNVISAVDTIYDDTVISNRVSTIENKIPSEATSSNQLADKAFVHDQIAINASNFRGDWANWTAVPTDSQYYPEDYTGNKKPNNNDYLIIQNATDYDPSNTGIWRFVYKGDWDTLGKSGWEPQYRVEQAFTQEQLNAINSGITSQKVSNYDNYRQEIDDLFPLIAAGL